MTGAKKVYPNSHVVDILGNVKGRDQPIMLLDRALKFVSIIDDKDFLDGNTVFINPFCKAGEILLASAFRTCILRFQRNSELVSLEEIQKELYQSNRYFGMAPDERHHRLSLRTFLGNEHSHNEELSKIIRNGDYVSEINGNLDREKFEKEFEDMLKFVKEQKGECRIVALGNPPYQESDNGFGKSANNIYQHFAQALIDEPRITAFSLVIPARWFAGGKGLKGFRNHMMETPHLKELVYFTRANEVFPTVDINGGVCFIHYDKTYEGNTNFISGSNSIEVSFDEYDIIPDDPNAFSIIKKVLNSWNGEFLGQKAWSSKPFGLRTFYFDKNPSLKENDKNAIKCKSKSGFKYADMRDVTRNKDKINTWKVICPKAAGGSKGKRRSTIPLSVLNILGPGEISTETYNVLTTFKTKSEAENFCNYLKTDFVRYMVGLRKITQDVPPDRWNWVPYVDAKKKWTDSELFKLFKISKEEQENIKQKVEEWS